MHGLEIALAIPDLWQQDAVRALRDGKDVVVDAPTGAGKTWIFELFVGKSGRDLDGQAIYTVPTRALANDKRMEWQARGWRIGIATGDLSEDLDAPIVVATLETQRERFLGGDGPRLLVVDEYQMLADEKRGLNYELALAMAPPETQLLLLSGSVANPQDIADWFQRLGRRAKVVSISERPVPLDELPIETLPRAPDSVKGVWGRIAAQVLMADLGPLLIFAPQRADVEKIARKVAAALPEDNPIELPPAAAALIDKPFQKLLRSRVAWHHSGLSYAARSGVVEPLARKGQLRVIVATMGLAAGINFSVRSVLVADTSYRDGAFRKELRHDELLQMFGRAGRRGLDDAGYVITTRNSARMIEAAPRRLRRVNEIDWPTLLRVMDHAAHDGRDPFVAAAEACQRLFSAQSILLGVEREARDAPTDAEPKTALFNHGPRCDEFLDSTGAWRHKAEAQTDTARAADALVYEDDAWLPALQSADFVRALDQGRLCRLGKRPPHRFGKEWKVARRQRDKPCALLKWVRDSIDLEGRERFSEEEIAQLVVPELAARHPDLTLDRVVGRGPFLYVRVDYSNRIVDVVRDPHGAALVQPPERSRSLEAATEYADPTGRRFEPAPNSAAHAWRKLGLVDGAGRPNDRGRIFSFFHSGEGLMVAAALEEPNYPAEEIAWHLANLRAGFRFGREEAGESQRLATIARARYGMVDHSGYLELGICPGYGEGAAEALQEFVIEKKRGLVGDSELLSHGDLERCLVEWLSLLRHICHAPVLDNERWRELQSAAGKLLERFGRRTPETVQLPARLLQRTPKLRLVRSQFRRG